MTLCMAGVFHGASSSAASFSAPACEMGNDLILQMMIKQNRQVSRLKLLRCWDYARTTPKQVCKVLAMIPPPPKVH